MRWLFVVATTVILTFAPVLDLKAQSPEMPLPNLVVKDADGRVIAAVVGFDDATSGTGFPTVVLNIEGRLAYLVFRPYGLIDRVAASTSNIGGPTVFYSGTDCTGDPFVNGVSEVGMEALSGNAYGVAGPDPITGEYKLYRSTSLDITVPSLNSKWQGGTCLNYGPLTAGVLAAQEVLPNPLASFHGPTTANPERLLTIEGGTRLP